MKKQLKDICETITKGTTPTTLGYNYQETGINFVKIESISSYGMFEPEKFAHISDECNIALRRSQLKENDILFSIAGAIGRTAIVNKSILPANTNQALAIIRLNNSEEYNLKFLRFQLASEVVLRQTERQKQGVAQLNLSLKDIGNLELSLPSLSDQQKIATELDTIQSAIDNKKQQLSLLDEAVKSEFVEMFGNFNCDIKTIAQTCTMKSGTTFSKDEELDSGDLFYIKVSGMNLPENDKYINKSLSFVSRETAGKSIIPANSIIFPKRGGAIGTNKKRITLKDICIDLNTMAVTPSNELNIQYLYQYFQNLDMGKLYNGSTVPQINNKDIGPLKIKVPPLELQNKFASFVQQIDKSKFVLQQQLQIIEKYDIMTNWRKLCFYTTVAM